MLADDIGPRALGSATPLLCRLLLALLAFLATAGCDELFKTDGGEAGAPSSDDGAADPCASVTVERFLGSFSRVCSQVAACYPDLQSSGASTCRAPAPGGGKIAYQRFSSDDLAQANRCLRAYAEPALLSDWMCCQEQAVDAQVDCYGTCPEFGNKCADEGNAATQACNTAFDGTAALEACFASR